MGRATVWLEVDPGLRGVGRARENVDWDITCGSLDVDVFQPVGTDGVDREEGEVSGEPIFR
jgi:hypothetical protein